MVWAPLAAGRRGGEVREALRAWFHLHLHPPHLLRPDFSLEEHSLIQEKDFLPLVREKRDLGPSLRCLRALLL